ncbi:hypothetical protein TVAG_156540 [Trichomonas vaginalis G3]|uniref:DNA-directed RNA polymerase III subunit RPC3 n=1 Tax=Trichomonas vaginalis (strain ATCC PRA-98 / G3) TaxID=412133 RepID=A2FRS6_TRIV3|nr:RNA polymerase III DNA directed -related family [Trichomonas vaginalis G3]EAX92375.1 hypothetical protein TVAG_156540 [Trichomonas vaginalis G3]KAI5544550.1 RNA polymerase III DNA directed -related family [Trichomonas vaginalis G3]|eukprot:XP_001305305.1 hypothetical protein [Trichomonas vaginalis G3]
MSASGLKRDLVLMIVEVLFGSTARTVAEAINDYGPCPLGFISSRTNISVSDVQTVCLAMYVHGVVNIHGEGKRATLTLATLPLFILAAPSILLEEIRTAYAKQELLDVLYIYLLQGICTVEQGAKYFHQNETRTANEFQGTDESNSVNSFEKFDEVTKELFNLGFLCRGIRSYHPFTSQDVISLERRINNLQLNQKRVTKAQQQKEEEAMAVQNRTLPQQEEIPTDAYSVDWNACAQFIRARYIINYVNKAFGPDYGIIIDKVVTNAHCCNYVHFRKMAEHSDDQLRNEGLPYSRLSGTDIYRQFSDIPATVFFERLDKLSNPSTKSIFGLLTSAEDGTVYDFKVHNCIRKIQLMYVNSFAETALCPMHGRIFETLQDLEIADTRQLEDEAIVSDKEARCAMYNLCRMGLTQIQAIPKTADRMLKEMYFVWKYNEDSVIAEAANNIGKVALNMWDKITSCIEEADHVAHADSLDKTATMAKSQEDKNLAGFHSYFIDQMRLYVLLAEM